MDDDELLATFAQNGVSPEQLAIIRQTQKSQQKLNAVPEVQPANLLIVTLFHTVAQYWIMAGMEGQRIALDPVMVETRASKILWYQELDKRSMELVWQGLDVMARTCATVWKEQKQRQNR
jgi:hypothetical protein